ncbi:MAG: M20/M25/M40 family metallo-hydrolase [Bryobacteraceae bacterium]|nr:M20/M25/M40 family metallo-hydrolase [Bryobacteraceae bacterium]
MRWTLWLLPLGLLAQRPPAADAARRYREANETKIIREYVELLKIPNVSADRANIRRNAAQIAKIYAARGVRTELVELEGANPAVYGELLVPGATRTYLIYAHYDGQPVDPANWKDSGPFEPVLRTAPVEANGKLLPIDQPKYDREWRLFARSATDDKIPIMALAAALDAMNAAGIKPKANLKFFFEGEEEAGSPNLSKLLAKVKDRLRGDVWLICDGPVHQSRAQSIGFGARGVAGLELTVYGAKRGLHSGHYGNWAPNPAMNLARLLASMNDGEGRVLVKGFYDDVVPLTALELDAIATNPPQDDSLKKELGIAESQPFGGELRRSIYQPTLNVRGLESAGVGQKAANVVPPEARASIDLRLVKGNDGRRQADKVIAHIREQGYFVVEGREPTGEERAKHPRLARVDVSLSYNAFRTPLDLPIAQEIVKVAKSVREPVILIPSSGGSLPLVVFEEVTGVPVVGVPIANHDDNQHTHNENMRIGNLWDGIELLAALLAM